jgi:acetyltransferase-like isoleucine patch superfamily enzyme
MIVKNVRQRLRLLWNWLNIVARYDVLVEPGVTIKYWKSIRFGRKCTIQSVAYLYGSRRGMPVVFGDHVVVSHGCMILGEGGVSIGEFSHLGPRVVITTQYGGSGTDQCTPTPEISYEPVKIGRGCWVGSGAVIMPGAKLGDRCVVAPNSVVYGAWDSELVLSGNPARPRRSEPVP